MANYEKQEAAYPIPISLYNCYRIVRHEKRGIYSYTPDSVSHASLSCKDNYRGGVCSLLFHLFCHPFICLLYIQEVG